MRWPRLFFKKTNSFHPERLDEESITREICETYNKKSPFGGYFDNIFNTCLNMIKLAPQNGKILLKKEKKMHFIIHY